MYFPTQKFHCQVLRSWNDETWFRCTCVSLALYTALTLVLIYIGKLNYYAGLVVPVTTLNILLKLKLFDASYNYAMFPSCYNLRLDNLWLAYFYVILLNLDSRGFIVCLVHYGIRSSVHSILIDREIP